MGRRVPKRSLRERLAPFLDAGLLDGVPSRWQRRRAAMEMAPYVISRDATLDAAYLGAPLGHPLLRQPLIASQVGRDHFVVGDGLGVGLDALCTHLHLTHHLGLPVFDLQIVQTHEGGLSRLRVLTQELLENRTPRARRLGRLASLILADPPAYHRQFLGDDDWIARAAAMDYPSAADEASRFPPEFFSLVGLLNYALTLPSSRPSARGVARHLGRHFREGRAFGWFRPQAAV